MWMCLRRVPAFVLTSMLLTAVAYAGDDGGQGPSARGPIFDITHFDVLPVNTDTPNSFEQMAYTALFAYRNASETDPGSKSFRVVNWLAAPNHSQIIDVWSSPRHVRGTSGATSQHRLPVCRPASAPSGLSVLQLLYR